MQTVSERTMLILDDEDDVFELVKEQLAEEGWEIQHFYAEKDFLGYVDGDDFNEDNTVALIDISLGQDREGGFKAAGKLSDREIRLPIIFVSASALEENISRSAEAGSYAYLNKSRLKQYPRDLRAAIAQAEGSHRRYVIERVSELNQWGNRAIVLASSLGHDIKGLISPLLAASLALKQRALAAPQLDQATILASLDRIIRDLDRARSILSNSFDFIGGRKDAFSRTEIDLVQIGRDLVTRHTSERPPVRFHSDCDRAIIYGDETLVAQVLYNLIDNAQKHASESAYIEVSVALTQGEADISVRDYGTTTLVPSEVRRIWRPLVRGRKAAGFGGGIGLAVVKEFAEMLGGSNYHAYPDDGQVGNRFGFRIPLASSSKGKIKPED